MAEGGMANASAARQSKALNNSVERQLMTVISEDKRNKSAWGDE